MPCDFSHRLRLLRWCVVLAIGVAFPVPGRSLHAADIHSFHTDVRGTPAGNVPVVTPWRVVTVDPQYGGYWVVAADIDGNGEIEIVSAQNFNDRDNHFTSAAVAQRLDGSVLWRWGDPKLGRRELHHDVACQIHDLDHNGVNEVIVAADRQVVVLDGPTGEVRWSFAIPKNASDCVTFADPVGPRMAVRSAGQD